MGFAFDEEFDQRIHEEDAYSGTIYIITDGLADVRMG